MTDVRTTLIDQLAYVRACDAADLTREIEAAGGNLEIDSKEGQTVAIRVEVVLGLAGLILPEDQNRENLTSVDSLTALIQHRVDERKAAQN